MFSMEDCIAGDEPAVTRFKPGLHEPQLEVEVRVNQAFVSTAS